MADSIRPAFVLLTGDLVRDALRVPEVVARGYYDLLAEELARFTVPVHTVPGNHEIFGIERASSLVSPGHPLYGDRMYRFYRGPDYYSFSHGSVRFLGLNTVDYLDQWYNGHVDSLQLEWIGQELARAPVSERIVTFNHIPFVSGGEARAGYQEDGLAPTSIRVDGIEHFRHNVRNHEEVLSLIGPRLEIALAGHIHMREAITYMTQGGPQRLQTAAAVVGPTPGQANAYGPVSGITLYRVHDGRVDDGTFLPLDPPGGP
jgi:3',5'-cyclic AMP phosphodiesterase CpdA